MCALQAIRDEKYQCPLDKSPLLPGLARQTEIQKEKNEILAINGVQVVNNPPAFRMRKRPPVKKQASHPVNNSRSNIIDLPGLIVTRLSKN